MLSSIVRNRLVRTTLDLHGKTLVYRRAGFWAVRESEYDLTRFADVDAIESSDREWVYLGLRRAGDAGADAPARAPGDPPPVEIATRSASESEIADLEMVADALREAVWPERAAARTRKSTFTRIGPDAIESDKGFAVRLPAPGRVEYSRDGKTLSLDVQRGWTDDHAMCFVIDPQALSRWDGAPADQTLPAAVRREILHDLGEALREWGVSVAVGGAEQRD